MFSTLSSQYSLQQKEPKTKKQPKFGGNTK